MSADLAAIMADLPEPERLPPGRLSKLQRAILAATAVATYNDWDGEDGTLGITYVTRRAIRTILEHWYWQADPDRSYDQQVRSWHASFNRSLTTLHERGYVVGLALAWVLISHDDGYHEDLWDWQGSGRKRTTPGGSRERRPELKRIGLTDLGWGSLRIDGKPIGDLLPDRSTLGDRVAEEAWEVERARLVVEWVERGGL